MKTNILLLLLMFLLAACSSDSDTEADPDTITPPTPNEEISEGEETVPAEGSQVFQIEVKELTSNKKFKAASKNGEPAFVLVSMVDASNNEVYTREPFALVEREGSYETEEIPLEVGTYDLTEFIVLDTNDVVISMVPQAGSALAVFSDTTLPFEFTVLEAQTTTSPTDTIEAAGLTAIDFGYGELNLDFPENTDFFSMTVDETQELTTKILTLESLTGAVFIVDWGDGSIEEYVSNVTASGFENTVTHNYSENGEYNINVSGPIATIELLELTSDQESSGRTQISSVSVEKLVLLKHCGIYGGTLTKVDLTTNTALEFLGLDGNQITTIDLSKNPNLKSLSIRHNQLTRIDLSNNVNLEFVSVFGNQITSMDVSNNRTLFGLSARANQLTTLDVSNSVNLNFLDVNDNLLTAIDVSNNINLTNINVGSNALTAIDFSQNNKLNRIDLDNNQISTIDLSHTPDLEKLYINDNLLSDIDLSNTPRLERLIIGNNNFNSLDLSGIPEIFELQINGNQFDAIRLDAILSEVHKQATTTGTRSGYVDFRDNPGAEGISNATLVRINELISSYDWAFRSN
ncbi:MAG: hypothetical protein AAF717_02145 [Bacteroidota bacterium]